MEDSWKQSSEDRTLRDTDNTHMGKLDKLCSLRRGRISVVCTATRCGLLVLVGSRFPAPVQADVGNHAVSFTMGTGSFPGVKWPRHGVNHVPHLAPRLKKE
jgi:hypothetical protein